MTLPGENRLMKRSRFPLYAWGVLLYTLLVILWGAYVRATGSGAGCGRHWPLCNGQVVPRAPQIETIIEFTHRLSSGLLGILVIVLLLWAFRVFPKGHAVRKAAVLSLVFVITEGLVGAGLVLFEWVAHNDSVARALSMAVHLVNTFLLLGSLTLTAWWATTVTSAYTGPVLRLRQERRRSMLLAIGLLLVAMVSAAGAVTALGDTLFPAGSLSEGVARDFSPTAHFLERLRIWHPILAVGTALYLFTTLGLLLEKSPSEEVRRFVKITHAFVAIQIVAGAVNIVLLAPVWMQLVHLLLADAVWLSLTLLAAVSLREPAVVASGETAAEAVVVERELPPVGAG